MTEIWGEGAVGNVKGKVFSAIGDHATLLMLTAMPKTSALRQLFADRAGRAPAISWRASGRAASRCISAIGVMMAVGAFLGGASGAWSFFAPEKPIAPDGWVDARPPMEPGMGVKSFAWLAALECPSVSCKESFDVVDLGAGTSAAVDKLGRELAKKKSEERLSAIVRWRDKRGQARAILVGSKTDAARLAEFVALLLAQEKERLSVAGAAAMVSAMDDALARGATDEKALADGRAARSGAVNASKEMGYAKLAQAFAQARSLSIDASFILQWIEASGGEEALGKDGFAAQQFATHVLAPRMGGFWILAGALAAGALALLTAGAMAWRSAVNENKIAIAAVRERLSLWRASGGASSKKRSSARRI